MRTLLPFILFLTVFLTVYGLVHSYFYIKLRSAVTIPPFYNWLLLVVLIFLLTAPILTNIAARHEHHRLATFVAYIGYIWMGILFLFFSTHLLIDIYRGVIHVSSRVFSPLSSKLSPGNTVSFAFTVLISLGVIIYGMLEAGNISVQRILLKTEKLPSHITTIRLVQISDIHFSSINGVRLARKITDKIVSLNPDIIVSTGDLTDRGLVEKERVTTVFRRLEAPYGKYAVTGNHEFYTGIGRAVDFTEKAGFRLLRNEAITIGGIVNLVGVDDPTAKRFGIEPTIAEHEILKEFSKNQLVILLKHRPMVSEKSLGKFDLQLSGHLHKGQIFPFSVITSILFPYHSGLYRLRGHAYLYVSRGTGTWGPPARFLSPPEITVIEFQRME
jgi:predicted MPP superfamily phosphohydrolase